MPGALADEAARQGASHSDTTPGRALAEVLERGGVIHENRSNLPSVMKKRPHRLPI